MITNKEAIKYFAAKMARSNRKLGNTGSGATWPEWFKTLYGEDLFEYLGRIDKQDEKGDK